jgi:hypothetical protein
MKPDRDMAGKGWLETVWAQAFRDVLVVPPARFLGANLIVGLFSIILLLAGARQPERTNAAFDLLVASTIVTHLGGFFVATAARRLISVVLFVQGLALFAMTSCLVIFSVWLTLHAPTLSNIRYVPGIALSVLTYSAIEIGFFFPATQPRPGFRKLGIALGAIGELALGAALVWRLIN